MKTKLVLLLISATIATSFAGNVSQSIAFDDLGLGGGTPNSGIYSPGSTFSFDVLLTYSGYNSTGLDFWFETDNALAPFLAITGVTYGSAFPDPIDTEPNPAPFSHTPGASTGYMTENRNCGSTINDFGNIPGPGTYFVAHVTFSIGLGVAPGNYDLASTVVLPHASSVSSFDGTNFAENDLPAAHYAVFIGIPEPGTFVLVGVGAIIGLGLSRVRPRRSGAAAGLERP